MTAFTQLVDKRANRYQQLFLTPNNNKSNLKLDRKDPVQNGDCHAKLAKLDLCPVASPCF